MTNLKALPMLNKVMLWVARALVASFILLLCNYLWQNIGYDKTYTFKDAAYWILAILWFICLWMQNNILARFSLGLSAALSFFYVAYHIPQDVKDMEDMLERHMTPPMSADQVIPYTKLVRIIDSIKLVCLCFLLWVSFRPPQKPSLPQAC